MAIRSLLEVCLLLFNVLAVSQAALPNPAPLPKEVADIFRNLHLSRDQNQQQHLASLQDFTSANAYLVDAVIPDYIKKFIDSWSRSGEDLGVETLFNSKAFDDVSPQCLSHVGTWLQQLSNWTALETWALHMVDAWGKIPEGILRGHVTVTGDYDECVGLRGAVEEREFRGLYCDVMLIPTIPLGDDFDSASAPQPMSRNSLSRKAVTIPELLNLIVSSLNSFSPVIPSIGTCLPSSCRDSDVQALLSGTAESLGNVVMPFVRGCSTDEKPPLDAGTISMIVVLGIIGGLCVTGTLIDVLMVNGEDKSSANRKGILVEVLLAFSLHTNILKWLNTKGGSDNLDCVHGIRFLSTAWVVLGHTWMMGTLSKLWNTYDGKHFYEGSFMNFAIINATPSVDTFFTLSGLLLAYLTLKSMDKSQGKLNIPMLYLHRYLRLTPTYALLIGIFATIFPYLGNGPTWYMMELEGEKCRKNWWQNLLYINNLVNYNEESIGMCHGESWYLGNDMQFFIVAPFIIYVLHKWEKIGLGLMAALSAGSIAVVAILTGVNDLPPTTLMTAPVDKTFDYYRLIYWKPWSRCGPYLVGMFTGYLLYKNSKSPIRVPKIVPLIGWPLATATAMLVIFGVSSFEKPDAEYRRVASIFYSSHRFVWGVVICWIIFACVKGHGGWVNRFLSWKAFIPLGRLTFCVYLTSQCLQMLFHLRLRQPTNFDNYEFVNYYFAHMVMSLIIGFICCMTMESPFIVLDKIIFARLAGSNSKAKTPAPKKLVEDVEKNNHAAVRESS